MSPRPLAARAGVPVLLALLLGLGWTLHLQATGLRMSGDSGLFAHTALLLESTGEWSAPPTRPPVYPALLALFSAVEPFTANAGAWLSGFVLTTLLVCLGLALATRTRSGWLSAAVVLGAAVWTPLVGVFEVMWTEGTCGALLLIHVVLVRTDRSSSSPLPLVAAGMAVGLAAATRFLAMAAVVTFLLWLCRQRPRPRDLLAGLLALGIPGAWLVRSRLLRGSATGERRPSSTGWVDNLQLMGDTLSDALASAPLFGAVVVASILALTVGRRLPRYLTLQVVAQLSAIVVATSLVAVDPLGARYLAPIMPLFLLYVGDAWAWLDSQPIPHRRRISRLAVGVVAVASVTAVLPFAEQQRAIYGDSEYRSLHGRGFLTSLTRLQLSEALAEVTLASDELHIAVIADRNALWQWGSLGRHRSIWSEAGIDVHRVEPDGAHTLRLEGEDSTGRPVTVHLHRGAPFRDAATIRRLVGRIDTEDAPLFALAHTGDLRRGLGSDDLEPVLGEDFQLQPVATPAPYALVRLGDAPAQPQLAEARGAESATAEQPPVHGDDIRRYAPAPPPSTLECTDFVPVHGLVRVTAQWRGDGLAKGTAARLMVGLKDAQGRPMQVGPTSAYQRVATLVGNQPWKEVDATVAIQGARKAQACIKVVGPTSGGAVEVSGLEVSAAPASKLASIN